MAKSKKTNADLSVAQKVEIGVGLTAAAVAAAGAYFLYGSTNAAKNRKAVKSWALKAKAEVLEKLEAAKEMAKEMTQEEYEAIINTVAATYADLKNASKIDIKDFKDEMKKHWSAIEKTARPKKKATKKAPAKAVVKKTVVKKVVAKKAAK